MILLPEVDEKGWPFVISVVPPDASFAFFERYFVKQMEICDRKTRWVHLVDVRAVNKLPDAKVRNMMAENTKKLESFSARFNMGTALVIPSTLARGVLTAIHWISPPTYPFACVATVDQGVEYLRGCLEKAGLPVPMGMSAGWVDVVAQRVVPGKSSAAQR